MDQDYQKSMKLLTHNMLECHIKGVTNKYPFKVEVEQLETCESDFNPDFLRRIFPKIDWKAFKETADSVSFESPSVVFRSLPLFLSLCVCVCTRF